MNNGLKRQGLTHKEQSTMTKAKATATYTKLITALQAEEQSGWNVAEAASEEWVADENGRRSQEDYLANVLPILEAANVGRSYHYMRQAVVTWTAFKAAKDREDSLSFTHHKVAANSASGDTARAANILAGAINAAELDPDANSVTVKHVEASAAASNANSGSSRSRSSKSQARGLKAINENLKPLTIAILKTVDLEALRVHRQALAKALERTDKAIAAVSKQATKQAANGTTRPKQQAATQPTKQRSSKSSSQRPNARGK